MEMKEAVVVSYARTAFTRAHKGGLKDTRPDEMSAFTIKAAVERAEGLDPADVEDVVIGCAFPRASREIGRASCRERV